MKAVSALVCEWLEGGASSSLTMSSLTQAWQWIWAPAHAMVSAEVPWLEKVMVQASLSLAR